MAVTLGDAVAGAQMLGAADAVRAEIGCPFPPLACHVDRDQLVEAGQAALGAEQWEAARHRGATLTLEAVLEEAEHVGPARRDHLAVHIGEVFVGRADELELMRSSWAGALSGQRQVVLLAGEPGIGTTRLAGEFAAGAADDGALVLQGRCEEEMLVPYQPFVDVLRQYVVDAPIERLRAHASRAGELVRLIPELAERMPELPAPRPADGETERFRLFEAVASLFEAASSAAPLLVVLDDLQWADRSALLLLKYLARGRSAARILYLGMYRDTELDRHHPLWETVTISGASRTSPAWPWPVSIKRRSPSCCGPPATAATTDTRRAWPGRCDRRRPATRSSWARSSATCWRQVPRSSRRASPSRRACAT